jgi:hypothetical protein
MCQPLGVPHVILWVCHMFVSTFHMLFSRCATCQPCPLFFLQLLKATNFSYDVCLNSFKLCWIYLDKLFDMNKFASNFETINFGSVLGIVLDQAGSQEI